MGVRHSDIEGLAVDEAELCDDEVVQETCNLLSGVEGSSRISKEQLQTVLVSSDRSTTDLWLAIGLDSGAPANCKSVCLGLVDILTKFGECPPRSDVGCRVAEDGSTTCDVDLSADAIKARAYVGDLPDFQDEEILAQNEEMFPPLVKDVDDPFIRYSLEEMVQRSANLFRIFPRAVEVGVFNSITLPPIPTSYIQTNFTGFVSAGCHSACHNELFCIIPKCMSCEMCRKAPEPAPEPFDPPPQPHRPEGRPTLVRPAPHPGRTIIVPQEQPPPRPQCDIRICNRPSHCKYMPTDCSGCYFCEASWLSPAQPVAHQSWLVDVKRRNLEAQAYVNTAIRKFHKGKTSRLIDKWFGSKANTDPAMKQKVQRTLNSVQNMLGNVEYKFPGPTCKPSTYAYVYPRGPGSMNNEGQYIFYLCQLYFDSETSVQIETLTHEGSHHAVAYLDDVKFKGGVAYGRSTCQELAASDSKKAINNADNFCYYVQDITDDRD